MRWDEENLYIGFSTNDDDIWAEMTERDASLWEDGDEFGILLDPLGDGTSYIEIDVNALGTVFDAFFPQAQDRDPLARAATLEDMVVAIQVEGSAARDDIDIGWSAEIRLPWHSMPPRG